MAGSHETYTSVAGFIATIPATGVPGQPRARRIDDHRGRSLRSAAGQKGLHAAAFDPGAWTVRIGVGLKVGAADRIAFDQRHVLGTRRQQAQSEQPATGIQIDDGPVGDERHHVSQERRHEKPVALEKRPHAPGETKRHGCVAIPNLNHVGHAWRPRQRLGLERVRRLRRQPDQAAGERGVRRWIRTLAKIEMTRTLVAGDVLRDLDRRDTDQASLLRSVSCAAAIHALVDSDSCPVSIASHSSWLSSR